MAAVMAYILVLSQYADITMYHNIRINDAMTFLCKLELFIAIIHSQPSASPCAALVSQPNPLCYVIHTALSQYHTINITYCNDM